MIRRFILLISFFIFGEGLFAQISLPIQAKGMWIWMLWSANSGSLSTVIAKLKSVGATWVVVKMGDSDSYYNRSGKSLYNWAATYGGMDSVVSIFHMNGIKIFGYQFVYGTPQYAIGPSESDVANMILGVKGMDGLLVDAEIEYDTLPNRDAAARSYMDSIRAHHPESFVGLTSWARVVVHATFPWVTFLTRVDVNMPQTYWAARPITPATELSRMSSDFTTYTQIWLSEGDSAAAKPVMPIGQAEYFGYGSNVKPGDISNFCSLSQTQYSYQGVSLWEYAQISSSFVWDEYAAAWPSTSVPDENGTPNSFGLSQNYPNPFNSATLIGYTVAGSKAVMLAVYDILGREVAVLVNERKAPGSYTARFDASGLASGVYLYRLQAGNFVETKRLVLLK
jgi:hypothetical protein